MRATTSTLLPVFLVLANVLAACASPAPENTAQPSLTPTEPQVEQPSATPSRTPRLTPFHAGLYPTREPGSTLIPQRQWEDVLQFVPYPYSTPLPPSEETPLDGLYGMFDPGEPQWYRCARCADFRPSGGIWRLQFDRGVMRLYYEVSGFATASSFTVDGDHLFLFNDPHCLYDVGEYTWELKDGSLVLTEVHDECAIHLRAVNLTRPGWLSCEAQAETGETPPGCD